MNPPSGRKNDGFTYVCTTRTRKQGLPTLMDRRRYLHARPVVQHHCPVPAYPGVHRERIFAGPPVYRTHGRLRHPSAVYRIVSRPLQSEILDDYIKSYASRSRTLFPLGRGWKRRCVDDRSLWRHDDTARRLHDRREGRIAQSRFGRRPCHCRSIGSCFLVNSVVHGSHAGRCGGVHIWDGCCLYHRLLHLHLWHVVFAETYHPSNH